MASLMIPMRSMSSVQSNNGVLEVDCEMNERDLRAAFGTILMNVDDVQLAGWLKEYGFELSYKVKVAA